MSQRAFASALLLAGCLQAADPPAIGRWNPVWEGIGATDRDGMPLGNGIVGATVWCTGDGVLHAYVARNDALTEADRLVKLGLVEITCVPNPFTGPVRHELDLATGTYRITNAAGLALRVWVDADRPVLRCEGRFPVPTAATVRAITWRTASQAFTAPAPIRESADLLAAVDGQVELVHVNQGSCVQALAEEQGLGDALDQIPDLQRGRIFGFRLAAAGAVPQGTDALDCPASATLSATVTTHSDQVPDLAAWRRAVAAIPDPGADASAAATARWWQDYWRRSWIEIRGDAEAEAVTRGYVLTKWLTACAARGPLPIRFNGSLFTTQTTAHPGGHQAYLGPPVPRTLAINPDSRPWGYYNLWQNQRLPYDGMLMRGEADFLPPLFAYYRRFTALERLRAARYHHAEGQHSTEMSQSCGLHDGGIYGWDRTGKALGYNRNRWGGGIDVVPGLERLGLELDAYEFTGDAEELQRWTVPYARDLFRYLETRFTARDGGRIVLAPLHCTETYWDTTDPLPAVAGMRRNLERLLAIPGIPGREDFARWLAMTPDLPTAVIDGRRVLLPAGKYEAKRQNVELPEGYAVHPFRCFAVGRPDLDLAVASFRHGLDVAKSWAPFPLGSAPTLASYSGWQQQGMVAARLGLTDLAREALVHNARLANPDYRFPAMWGMIYDGIPDVDHGANLTTTVQDMLLAWDGPTIRLLPAWPAGWDCDFRLHAPRNTVITGTVRGGRLVSVTVEPPERSADVVMP